MTWPDSNQEKTGCAPLNSPSLGMWQDAGVMKRYPILLALSVVAAPLVAVAQNNDPFAAENSEPHNNDPFAKGNNARHCKPA